MNNDDKSRLLTLCSFAEKESVIVFDDKVASVLNRSYAVKIALSSPISENKIGVAPDTLRSIIGNTKEDIAVKQLSVFRYSFKTANSERVIAVIDAENYTYPEEGRVEEELTITSPKEFANAINFVSGFAHKDDTHPTSSIFISFSKKSVDVIATNGESLGFKRYTQDLPFEDCNIVLTTTHAELLSRLLSSEGLKIAKIIIDHNRKVIVKSSIGSMLVPKASQEFRDFRPLVNAHCPINTDAVIHAEAKEAAFSVTEVKKALLQIISMFGKDEYPFVNVRIVDKEIKLESETIKNGYDCFRCSIPAKSTGSYSVQLSPIIMARALGKFSGAVKIMWKSGAISTVAPVTITHDGSEIIFFAPKVNAPRDDYDDI